LLKRGAEKRENEKKLLPFPKGGVPPLAGRRDQGTSLQINFPSDSPYWERAKIAENIRGLNFIMY
jgi:hypothetical protein